MAQTIEGLRSRIKNCALIAMKHRREAAELLVAGDNAGASVHLLFASIASQYAFEVATLLPGLDAAVLAA